MLSISPVSQAITALHCEYGVIPQATVLISETEMKNETEIGQYTEARYQGTPNQKLENIVLATQDFKATVLNPKSPYMKKMNGECQLK